LSATSFLFLLILSEWHGQTASFNPMVSLGRLSSASMIGDYGGYKTWPIPVPNDNLSLDFVPDVANAQGASATGGIDFSM